MRTQSTILAAIASTTLIVLGLAGLAGVILLDATPAQTIVFGTVLTAMTAAGGWIGITTVRNARRAEATR